MAKPIVIVLLSKSGLERRDFAVYPGVAWMRKYHRDDTRTLEWGKYGEERLTEAEAAQKIGAFKIDGWTVQK